MLDRPRRVLHPVGVLGVGDRVQLRDRREVGPGGQSRGSGSLSGIGQVVVSALVALIRIVVIVRFVRVGVNGVVVIVIVIVVIIVRLVIIGVIVRVVAFV